MRNKISMSQSASDKPKSTYFCHSQQPNLVSWKRNPPSTSNLIKRHSFLHFPRWSTSHPSHVTTKTYQIILYRESDVKWTEFTLLMCPLSDFLVDNLHLGTSPMSAHFSANLQSACFSPSAFTLATSSLSSFFKAVVSASSLTMLILYLSRSSSSSNNRTISHHVFLWKISRLLWPSFAFFSGPLLNNLKSTLAFCCLFWSVRGKHEM